MTTVEVLIRNRRHVFDLDDVSDRAGRGGQAVVKILGDEAVKIHLSYDPDLALKLADAPTGVHPNAIMPADLVRDAYNPKRVVGFTMRLVKGIPISMFGDADFQSQHNLTWRKLVQILLNLHDLVSSLHKSGIVLGDFNEKNVLVDPKTLEVFMVDMDAAWWGKWRTLTYTLEFTPAWLLKASPVPNDPPVLIDGAVYSEETDWFGFAAIVCKVLLGGTPYRDGTHQPKDGEDMQRLNQRVLSRLTFFDPSIRLFDEAIRHPALLPAGLGLFLHDVFVKDRRETPFPRPFLTTYVQMTCPKCGCEHSRAKCPKCGAKGVTTPTAPYFKPGQCVNGHVPGGVNILATYPFGETVRYVHHTGGAYRREDNTVVLRRHLSSSVSALIAGKRTVLVAGRKFAIVTGSGRTVQKKHYATQSVMGRATVAANSRYVYWMNGKNLVRNDPLKGIASIGSSPANQTSVWVGEKFGVTLVTEGTRTRVRTFTDTGFNGTLDLSAMLGNIVGAECVVGDNLAWLKITCQTGRQRTNTILVVDAHAGLLATAPAEASTAYLARLAPSALAAGNAVFVPIEGLGIVQFKMEYGVIRMEGILNIVTSFQDTVGFCLNSTGLVHVTRTAIGNIVSTS